MSGFGWTKQEDAVLRRMAADGKSFSDVATALGRSRNMVAGRAHRLGLAFLGGPPNAGRLTAGDVRAIRAQMTGAWGEQTRIARAYGVCCQHVSDIARGRRWKHA